MTNLSVDIGANWGAALTLLERLDIYQATSRPPLPHSALGQARAARWQSTEFPLVHELQACLSADDDQWSLLSAPPPWVTDSRRAWLANSSASDRSVQNGFADSERAFLKVAAPFLQLNETALRAFTDAMLSDDQRDSTVTSKVIDDLMEDLAAETLRLLTPVLALEVNVARLEQRFGAISASDRFLATIGFLSTATGRAQLLNTYPVLARSLTLCGQHWLAASQSFLRRLVNDMPAVREMLSLAGDDQVMSVSRPLGDPHRAGLSVKTVQFSSGAKIVYKPRSLAVDLHFQGLLTWLNAKGAMPPFRTLRVLDRTTHGWAEWIRPQPCSDVEEIRRFYRAAGGLLAVLYAIHGTDAHFENLVASGDTPLLVDLETLFHPMTSGPSDAEEHQPTEVDSPHSVLATGLLPVRRATEDIQADISGLTGAAGTAATPTLRWVELGTDRMRLTQEMAALNSSAHRPMLPDRHVTVVEFTDDVLTGFESTYRLVLTNRAELLAESGPLALFGRDETRVVFRNTRDYVYLLAWSRHPDCLRNALDRDFLFQQLRPEIARRPILSRVIDAECRDLHAGDVPIFTTRPASRDIESSDRVVLAEVLDEPGLDRARRTIAGMGPRDFARQSWLLRASIASTATPEEWEAASRTAHRKGEAMEPEPALSHQDCLAITQEIAERLETLAMAHPEGIIWPGLAFKDRRWTVTPVGCDLYFGLPGIALFLAQEGTLLRHDASLTLASRAIDSIVTALKRSGSSLGAVGAFSGWAGLLYCFAQVRHALNRGDLDGECEAILDRLPDCIARDQFFDIVGGAAGCLAVLLHLRTVLDESRCMELAVACADHLLQSAEASDDGLSWRSSPSNVALTGFGHGASGIAWALCRMFDATGDQRYLDAAVRAARFERQHYSDEFRNWTDLRPMDGTFVDRVDGSRYLTAWCHGAMGIGLARHELLRHTDDPHVRAEFDAAIATTWHNGFGRDDCLCHGSLGNLELFWAAAATSSLDPAYDVSALTTRIYRNLKRRGPFCSTPCAVDTPGLMVGLAGIGYQLLRLVNPMRVPSVLLLDGPCAAAGETAAHGHGAA